MSEDKIPRVSTQRFLELMQQQNEAIAAQNKETKRRLTSDPIREQREAERRDKYGQLRARPRRRKKTQQVTNVFGHTKLEPGPND